MDQGLATDNFHGRYYKPNLYFSTTFKYESLEVFLEYLFPPFNGISFQKFEIKNNI